MKKITITLNDELEYEHVFRLYSRSLPTAMETLMKTSWALETSLLPELVAAALAGHEGIYRFDDSNPPSGHILQRNEKDLGASWLLHYSTASGRNDVSISYSFCAGFECIITWKTASCNPPWDSSAVRDALANGWQHEGSSVLLPDMD